MTTRPLLIVGIDPGTTKAYALLDLHGTILKTHSSKTKHFNDILREVTKQGNVILVGTDKAKIPNAVADFATKTGSKVVSPKEDMAWREKKMLVGEKPGINQHVFDALAAATFAYNHYKPTIAKIEQFVGEKKRQDIFARLIELVILKEMPLHKAFALLTAKHKTKTPKIKVSKPEVKHISPEQLRETIRSLTHERDVVKTYLLRLKKANAQANKKIRQVQEKLASVDVGKKAQQTLSRKEQNIAHLSKQNQRKDAELQSMKQQIKKLEQLLLRSSQIVVIKKLRNLSLSEFRRNRDRLVLRKGDVLYVADPNIFHIDVVAEITSLVAVVIYQHAPAGAVRSQLPFTMIPHSRIPLIGYGSIMACSKEVFEKAKQSSESFDELVQAYQEERDFVINP